jgi:hypothetical protein
LTAIVARWLAIDEHMANLLPEPGSDPWPFLSDKHLMALGVADHQSIVLKATEAQQPQIPFDDLIVDPNPHRSPDLAEGESDDVNFSLPYAKLKLKPRAK